MALSYADLCQDTTATTGTGTYTLDETAPAGHQTFASGHADGATIRYCVTDGTDWEVSEGVLTYAVSDTLTRATVLASSNAGAAVNWGAGSKDIYGVSPADDFNRIMTMFDTDGAAATAATAPGANCIAIGDGAAANETSDIAIGTGATAGQSAGATTEQDAVAIGTNATAYESETIAIGLNAVAGKASSLDPSAIAIGVDTIADAVGSIAMGDHADSHGAQSVAIGPLAEAQEAYTIAIGYSAKAGITPDAFTEQHAIAIGNASDAFETGCIAIGYSSQAGSASGSGDPNAIGIGYSATAAAPEAIALGDTAWATDNASVSVGANAESRGQYCIGIGKNADARDDLCISIGYNSQAGTTDGATTNTGAIAIGDTAFATNLHGIAVGANTSAGHDHASCFGSESNSRRAHEMFVVNITKNALFKQRYGQMGFEESTANATPTLLQIAGTGGSMSVTASSVTAFDLLVTARDNTSGDAACYHIVGAVKRDGAGNTALVGTPTVTAYEDDATWDCSVTVDDTNDELDINITGDATNAVQWVGVMQWVETVN